MKTRKEKQFYDNLTHFIGYRLHSSILHFCDEAVCLLEDDSWEACFDKPKFFKDEEERLIRDFLNLDDILSLEEKDKKLEEINDRKQRLKEAAEYFECMRFALSGFLEASEEVLFNHTNSRNESYFAKYSEFLRFVDGEFGSAETAAATSTIVSLMPMRMTKEKFYSYLERSLQMFPPDMGGYALKSAAKTVSMFVRPQGEHDEDVFPLYGDFCKIYDFWMAMPKIKDVTPELKDTLRVLFDEADSLYEEISIAVETLEFFHLILNRLLVLLSGSIKPADLTNENIYLKDAYYTAAKMCSEEGDAEIFRDAYYKLSQKAFDAIEDKEALGEQIEEVADSKYFETFSRETIALYKSLRRIDNLASESLMSLPEELEDEQPAFDREEFDEYVRGVIESVKEDTQNYSSGVRKMKYRQVINAIFCPFDTEELHEYIKGSYESSSPEQRGFVGQKLEELFRFFGFPEDCKGDIKGYAHGHDCDCDCDCGHEHDCDCGHIDEDLRK